MLQSLEQIAVVCPSFPVAWCKTPFEYSNNEAAIISLFEF
jgi:hypothetical protein